MKNQSFMLYVGIGLVAVALLGKYDVVKNVVPNIPTVETTIKGTLKPNDAEVLDVCERIAEIISDSSASDKKVDVDNLTKVYLETANLIDLDDEIITNTQQVRSSHIIAAKLLRINLVGKYEGLADESNTLFELVLGNDDVALDDELRKEAVKAFKYLAWALQEGV